MIWVVAAALLAACGTETGGRASDRQGPMPDAVPPAAGEVVGSGLVMDVGDGPQFCLGPVAESWPPQCSGPPVVGWDWDAVTGRYEEQGDIRWGDFVLHGTFDGSTFTLGAVADEPSAPEPAPDRSDTACPEPPEGWVVDPATATRAHLERVFGAAEQLAGYAGSFLDTSGDRRTPEQRDADAAAGDDPVDAFVVNVQVTGDPVEAETALRDIWGGGLCVTRAEHTEAELQEILREVEQLPGFTSGGAYRGRVEVAVLHDDGTLQAWADARFGTGAVVVTSALRPA